MSQNGWIARLAFVATRIRMARLSQRLGLSIPPGAFGPGLCIPHYGTIVVNDKARFGSFCRIHASTNIGEYNGAAPIVGDEVYIGPGAVIYGNAWIGDRVIVGANSVVTGEFPADVTIAGAPARVIANKGRTLRQNIEG
ncbi:hypothetical protein LWF01_19150 [Saxibacter everestensis]|uniref:Serine acetyltransferase n=1 Tax=Saxibacter everestensis TaxID=2909229 RepID=A0ABY8QT44_9MICO|nr:hypothetical protein LWF01_19150 [Brevibacteriaceae bacterium ZFBP1038]